MTDEVSTGELARRLHEIKDILQGLVSRAEYSADQRAAERRFSELEQDITEKWRQHNQDIRDLRDELKVQRAKHDEELKAVRDKHDEDIKAVRAKVDESDKSSGVNFRQAVYNGLVPGILLLITALIGFLQLKGGK